MSEEDELLAAELALGLLSPEDARAAERLLATDAGFADAHARWTGYATGLLAADPETPRPSLWPAIVARLPANDVVALDAAARASGGLRRWQASTAITAAAAIVLGIAAVERAPLQPLSPPAVPVAAPAPPPLVAMLSGKRDDAVVMVSFDRASGRVTAAPARMRLGDGVPELWVIPADGKPRSLGVIPMVAPGSLSAPTPAMPAMVTGATLAISVEPRGGSPTGQPTGPVIMTGKITAT